MELTQQNFIQFLFDNWLALSLFILSIVFGLIIFLRQEREREPVLFVARRRIPVVSAEFLGSAPITILDQNAQKVEEDLTVVYLYLWNKGKRSIRKEHVFEKLQVCIKENEAVLLGARIEKESTGSEISILTEDDFPSKSFRIDFRLLNPNDGALIQIFLKGKSDAKLFVSGKIEEVPGKNINQEILILPSENRDRETAILIIINVIVVLITGAIFFLAERPEVAVIFLITCGTFTMFWSTFSQWLPFPGSIRPPKELR